MSLVALLVFVVVIGTLGALMVLTSMIERTSAQPEPYPVAPITLPAPRDGAVADAAADAVEPEAGVR